MRWAEKLQKYSGRRSAMEIFRTSLLRCHLSLRLIAARRGSCRVRELMLESFHDLRFHTACLIANGCHRKGEIQTIQSFTPAEFAFTRGNDHPTVRHGQWRPLESHGVYVESKPEMLASKTEMLAIVNEGSDDRTTVSLCIGRHTARSSSGLLLSCRLTTAPS